MLEDGAEVKFQTSALYVHGPAGEDLRARMAAAERSLWLMHVIHTSAWLCTAAKPPPASDAS
eukprot:1186847-Prorocentrum_minimum.AAC.1